jgi:SAM-dependent methyltransferase
MMVLILQQKNAMSTAAPRACPVCGAEEVYLGASVGEVNRESNLREFFVSQRLDHRPEEMELMDLTKFMHGGPGRLWSCPGCGLLSRDEGGSAHYEADVYDSNLMRHLYPRYLRAFEEKTQYKALLRERADVLEIGSHLGGFLQTAEQWRWRPTGLDIGASTSSFARRQGLSTKRLAIEDYFPHRPSDAVFIWNCFEQLDDPSATLHQSHRLLQPGGLLVVRVPNAQFYLRWHKQLRKDGASGSLKVLGYNNLLGFPYRYGYTPASLTRLLRTNGFNPIEAHNSSLLTPPYPEMSMKMREEWRAVRREGETSLTIDGPWIEVVSRRVAEAN